MYKTDSERLLSATIQDSSGIFEEYSGVGVPEHDWGFI